MAEETTEMRGVRVFITDPDAEVSADEDMQDIIIFIETTEFTGRNIRIRLNDCKLYEGDPEYPNEQPKCDDMNGWWIEQYGDDQDEVDAKIARHEQNLMGEQYDSSFRE